MSECNVCQEKFNGNTRQPTVLPCGHQTCRECINKVKKINQLCPICRQKFETAQPNYGVLELLAELDDKKKMASSQSRRNPARQKYLDFLVKKVIHFLIFTYIIQTVN